MIWFWKFEDLGIFEWEYEVDFFVSCLLLMKKCGV